jgi:hypothetical protein
MVSSNLVAAAFDGLTSVGYTPAVLAGVVGQKVAKYDNDLYRVILDPILWCGNSCSKAGRVRSECQGKMSRCFWA